MKQTIFNAATLGAALMFILAACSDEQFNNGRNPEKQPGASGPLITVTATQESRPQTRLGYDVPDDNTQPIAVTWAAGDKFYVGNDFSAPNGSISAATSYFSPFTLNDGGAGSNSAEFTGNLPTEIPNGATLYGIYGDGDKRITLESGALSFDYTNQVQSANDDKSHLSGVDFMTATTTYETGKQPVFAFTHLGAMIKFTLTLPTEGVTVKQLTLTTIDGSTPFSSSAQWNKDEALAFSASKAASASTTLLLGEEGTETGITLTGTKVLTAYMMVAPTTLTKDTNPIADKTLKLQMTDANGAIYKALLRGTDLEQSKYYTVTADLAQSNEMTFTVKVDANYKFITPFPSTGSTPAEITVDWGDGAKVKVPVNTPLTKDDEFNHTYTAAGTYTIVITSSQIDATKQQIPQFNFDFMESGRSTSNASLISMNTPILNSGQGSFNCCFNSSKLTSLPQGLFDNNTNITSFESCFENCSGLTYLPKGLFDKNTNATNFLSCFENCSGLTSLPKGLFDKNTQAKNFNKCFSKCSGLTSLPQGLFDNNTNTTTFYICFRNCSGLTYLPKGLFDNNTNVTNFSFCFEECSQLTELPKGLFDKNTMVTNFESCFRKCSGLTYLPKGLFDKNTMVTNFDRCFSQCSGLTSLPQGLFDKNTVVTNFALCFFQCSGLTSLPQGLFDKNTMATNFDNCFFSCSNLVLNEQIFSSDPSLDRFKGINNGELIFSYCFNGTGSALTPELQATSVAPQLWKYNKGGATWSTSNCYTDCKASNLTDVPTSWGTPAN